MRLRIWDRSSLSITYAISTGGSIQVTHRDWMPMLDGKPFKHATLRLRAGPSGHKLIIPPLLCASSDGLMAMAYPAIKYLLEEYRRRHAHEDALKYLAGAWSEVIARMFIKPLKGVAYLRPDNIIHILKEAKENA